MKPHKETMWVIKNLNGSESAYFLPATFHWTKRAAIDEFRADRTWRSLYTAGFRCSKVIVKETKNAG